LLDLGCALDGLGTTVGLVGLFAVEEFDFDVSVIMIGAGAGEDEENLELILDIHDDFVGVFSAELERLRKPGRRVEELRVGPALGVEGAASFPASCGLFCTFSCGFTCCGGCTGLSGGVTAGDG
jgi:hypothetical protein